MVGRGGAVMMMIIIIYLSRILPVLQRRRDHAQLSHPSSDIDVVVLANLRRQPGMFGRDRTGSIEEHRRE